MYQLIQRIISLETPSDELVRDAAKRPFIVLFSLVRLARIKMSRLALEDVIGLRSQILRSQGVGVNSELVSSNTQHRGRFLLKSNRSDLDVVKI